jgi:hypothetical protein
MTEAESEAVEETCAEVFRLRVEAAALRRRVERLEDAAESAGNILRHAHKTGLSDLERLTRLEMAMDDAIQALRNGAA